MKTFAVLSMAIAAAAILFTGSALAHSVLERSRPAGGETVASPNTIELTFSETVGAELSTIELEGPQANTIALGDLSVSDDGRTLRAPVLEELPSGEYDVEWGALHADGHRVSGAFDFSVK